MDCTEKPKHCQEVSLLTLSVSIIIGEVHNALRQCLAENKNSLDMHPLFFSSVPLKTNEILMTEAISAYQMAMHCAADATALTNIRRTWVALKCDFRPA